VGPINYSSRYLHIMIIYKNINYITISRRIIMLSTQKPAAVLFAWVV